MKLNLMAFLSLITLLTLNQTAFAVSDAVSVTLVEGFDNFEIGSSANFYVTSDTVTVQSEDRDNYLEMISRNAKPVTASKTIRPIKNDVVLEFKLKELDSNSNFDVYLRDGNYGKTKLCTFKGNNLVIGGTTINIQQSEDWIKLVYVLNLSKNICSLTLNESKMYNNIKLEFYDSIITGVDFVLTGVESAKAKIDDLRIYSGTEQQEEYSLLSLEGKTKYMLEDSVAMFLNYEMALVDNTVKVIDSENTETAPYLIGDTTYIPLRFVSESLGADVLWEDSEQKITISLNGSVIELWIGKKEMTVDGVTTPTSVAPILSGGRTFVPLRLVSENLKKTVIWDDRGLIIICDDNGVTKVAEYESIKDLTIENITGSRYVIAYDELIQISPSIDKIRMKPIKTISAVADYEPEEGNVAPNVFDSDFSTRWASDMAGTNVILDLGKVYEIGGYALSWMNGSKRVNYYEISYSTDGVNWTDMGRKISSGASDVYEFYKITPISARYIKYSGYGTLTHDGIEGIWNSVTEFVTFEEVG